jgi:hypothetical protein
LKAPEVAWESRALPTALATSSVWIGANKNCDSLGARLA